MDGQQGVPPPGYPPQGVYGAPPGPGVPPPYGMPPPMAGGGYGTLQAPPGGELPPPGHEGHLMGDGQPINAVEQQGGGGDDDGDMETEELPPVVNQSVQQQQEEPQDEDMAEEREEKEKPPPTDPHPTIYVNHINEKIKGEKLKRGLRQVFAVYGKIRKINVRKGIRFHGQAWITYSNTAMAMEAVDKAQNYNFYGKPLHVTYAYEKSDRTIKSEGLQPPKRPPHSIKNLPQVKLEKESAPAATTPAAAAVGGYPGVAAPYGMLLPPGAPGMAPVNGTGGAPYAAGMPHAMPVLPHNILFASGLPDSASEQMLGALFQQYPGFKEVRLVPGKAGIAFVEYAGEAEATMAMASLNGFKVDADHAIVLTYARK